MAGSLIDIGLSGIRAHQSALATTGQNITNASTPGYTRQRVNMETQVTAGASSGMHGVLVQGVERIYDEAAVNQLRLDTSVKAGFDETLAQISQVDSLLADEASNLNRGFERFFGALHSAANSPTSMPARQLVLAEAEGLVTRFQGLDGQLRNQLDSVNRQAGSELARINELAAGIGDLNARLGPMRGGDGNTNALLDQRDEMLRQLAEHVDVKTVRQGELGMNVFIGKGHALVVGSDVRPLRLSADGQVQLQGRKGDPPMAVDVRGGSLGGLLNFRDQTLQPVLNELGRLALGFAGTVNELHGQGIDLRGNQGGDLFADLNSAAAQRSRVQPINGAANATGAGLTLQIDDASMLEASNYQVNFASGGDRYQVRRISDGEIVAEDSVPPNRPAAISFDGLTLNIGPGAIAAGASFRLNAADGGVAGLAVSIRDARELAFASPVSISANDQNQGSGRVDLDAVNDAAAGLFGGDGELVPPLLVRFTGENSYEVLDNSDPTNPQLLSPPLWGLPFIPGGEQALLPDGGQRILVADGQDSGALPDSVSRSSDLTPAGNGFAPESVRFLRGDPAIGTGSQAGQVDIQAGMSARAIAAAMEQVDGVSAAARTELRISDLRDNGIGEPLTVAVNGEAIVLPAGSGVNDLADAISASDTLRAAGISARSDGTTLTLTSERGDDLALHVAGDVTDGIRVTDQQGRSLELSGSGPGGDYDTVTVGGSVRLLLDDGISVASDSVSPGGGLFSAAPQAVPAALGFQATVSGRPEAGDTFAINFNDAGNLDNHNALALANLQQTPTLGDPPSNFSESYSSIVERVGVRTSQARSDAQAAEGLLAQSVARRESLSGVNLEEEAANLIKFEQGYNASARVVSVARELFESLLVAVA